MSSLNRAVSVAGVSAAVICASFAGYFLFKRNRIRLKSSSNRMLKSPIEKSRHRQRAEEMSVEEDEESENGSEDEQGMCGCPMGIIENNLAPIPPIEDEEENEEESEDGNEDEEGACGCPMGIIENNLGSGTPLLDQSLSWVKSGERMGRMISFEPTSISGMGYDDSRKNEQGQDCACAASRERAKFADSPDMHSEASHDSGKGASVVVSPISPIEESIEVPPIYEFEVPKDIVGLLIGKNGTTIKWLIEQTRTHIVIGEHIYSDKHKICTVEGTREQINQCLRLIRRKFPPSRFPDLRLTPVLPAPAPTPASSTPVLGNVVQLCLLEGINCQVVISSIVNAGHVFLQQPTHPTFSSLSRLDQYLMAVYNQPAAGVPGLPRPVEKAVICAAPVLGGWYRAQTMEFYEDTDEVMVKFVDYGGYCRMAAADLRQIRSDFISLPFQATECYLANIAPAAGSESWSQEALSFLEQLSLSNVMEARVIGRATDNTPLVELYLSTSMPEYESISINRELVERGYAKWTGVI